MKTDLLTTTHIADAALFDTFDDANDHALLFNLHTLGNLEASCHLSGYHESAKYRIRVAHVRELGNNRFIHDTIGWISTEKAVDR